MTQSEHLWAIGYDDMERAEQVRDEIIRLGWATHYLDPLRCSGGRAPPRWIVHLQPRAVPDRRQPPQAAPLSAFSRAWCCSRR